MNLKILTLILFYYGVLSIMILTTGSAFSDDLINSDISSDVLTSNEIKKTGLFGTSISFTRFTVLLGFGVGLPDDTPSFVTFPFIIWQSALTIISIGSFVDYIWSG